MSTLSPSKEIATALPKLSPVAGFGSASIADNENPARAVGTPLVANPNPKTRITVAKILILNLDTERIALKIVYLTFFQIAMITAYVAK